MRAKLKTHNKMTGVKDEGLWPSRHLIGRFPPPFQLLCQPIFLLRRKMCLWFEHKRFSLSMEILRPFANCCKQWCILYPCVRRAVTCCQNSLGLLTWMPSAIGQRWTLLEQHRLTPYLYVTFTFFIFLSCFRRWTPFWYFLWAGFTSTEVSPLVRSVFV